MANKTETSLYDGMVITTSNSVGTVEVRAQSQGPGLCDVQVSTTENTVVIAAPPFLWSAWTELAAHVGSVTYTISTRINCDTGALFEIRYYR